MDEKDVKARVKRILELKGLSVNSFAAMANLNQPTINPQINGKVAIGVSTICALLYTFKDVSAEWIMRGDGGMLKLPTPGIQLNVGTMTGGNAVAGGDVNAEMERIEYEAIIKEKDARIAELTQDKERLNKLVDLLVNK